MATYTMYPMMNFVLLAVLVLRGVICTEFTVRNDAMSTPGGLRFEKEIGNAYTSDAMVEITKFIWKMLKQDKVEDRKVVDKVEIFVSNYIGAEAITYGTTINISSVYVEGYRGDVKWEITSLIYHEMTHVWQWTGAGQAPVGLVEGIADYTILQANYYPPAFAKPGMGDKWDQGYDFTARFLEYCESLRPGFVASLNKMMKDSFSVEYFNKLLGKSVDQLWKEYKAKYSGGKVGRKLLLN